MVDSLWFVLALVLLAVVSVALVLVLVLRREEAHCGRETRSIGIDADYGSLDAGRYGNVVLVDDKLDILKVVRHGEVIG